MSLTNLGSKMKKLYSFYQNAIQTQKDSLNFRFLKPLEIEGKYIFQDGRKLLNLSSNDYLGISTKKEIFRDFLSSYDKPLNVPSARLLCANTKSYTKLEELLCEKFSKEAALLFNSGYHANVGIMSSLLDKKDVVFSDKLNHASILDGIKLSEAKMFRYKHLDYNQLEILLQKHRSEYRNAIIVSESLFSMDGDFCDFKKLIYLKKKYNAILVIDEAHAFGVYGKNALGAAENACAIADIDLIIGTFGKSIASMGAFCTGDGVLIDYLINKARSLIFSTALPEINIAFTYYVITEILPNLTQARENLFKTAEMFRNLLSEYELPFAGDSHIVPVILGSNENSVNCANKLIDNGYYLLPIRHPTVALNSSRIRISLRADINYEEIKNIPKLIKEYVEISKNDIKLAM